MNNISIAMDFAKTDVAMETTGINVTTDDLNKPHSSSD